MSFNKQQERIKVPFAALSAFVDPSVRFGLQFDRKDKAQAGDKAQTVRRRHGGRADAAAGAGKAPAARRRPAGAEATPEAGAAELPRPSRRTPASKIVKLDSFRKK